MWNKYHNRVIKIGGERFHSLKELRRWNELLLLAENGVISDPQREVKFVLIPAQREEETDTPRGKTRPGKVIERELCYYADFCYYTQDDGKFHVEDAKGMKTEVYKIKKKLMLYIHGIRIEEI